MGNRKLKLYLPFLAAMLVQGLLAAVAPSDAPSEGVSAAGAFAPEAPGGDAFVPGDPTTVGTDPVTGATIPIGGGDGGPTPDGGSGSPTGSTPGTPGGPGAPVPGGPGGVAGDTSHCVGDRQMDVLLNNPSCKPRWVGPNGGATYQGVTADSVKIIQWQYVTNTTSDTLLASQGLATTQSDRDALDRASIAFLEKYYEFYGRSIDLERVQTECTTSPIDIPKCKQEARRVIAKKPFAVIIRDGTSYPEIYDEFARAGIITLGGWHWPTSYFTQRRPYRYDLFMDGNKSSDMLAEYYCKKMAGGTATHAGPVIHPQVGGRTTPRRIGILHPDRDTDTITAAYMKTKLSACAQTEPVVIAYTPDINQAGQEAAGYVQSLIANDVTTVICFCDPVVPIYLFRAMTQQNYYPEHLLSGTGLLDYDLLGRLYDQQQWVHAFGPGHLWDPLSLSETEVYRMWRASGEPGQPCGACNLDWSYWALMGAILHEGGPNLSPATVEAALLNATPYGGDRAGSVRVEFGPGDYTVVSDAREAYWQANRISPLDNKPGAYNMLNRPTRYRLGQWTTGLEVPVPNG